MMQRIIAMLFSSAVLLGRASHAPLPICWLFVRAFLRAEPMIRAFVIRTGWEAGAIAFFLPDPPAAHDKCREKALCLADCFQAFAEALQTLPKQLYERWRTCESLQLALRARMQKLGIEVRAAVSLIGRSLPPYVDTS